MSVGMGNLYRYLAMPMVLLLAGCASSGGGPDSENQMTQYAAEYCRSLAERMKFAKAAWAPVATAACLMGGLKMSGSYTVLSVSIMTSRHR